METSRPVCVRAQSGTGGGGGVVSCCLSEAMQGESGDGKSISST
jgi:hypothetical protein